ncbi:MAG: hypothetical protein ACYS1A_07860 [Planctomycetota bacterium]
MLPDWPVLVAKILIATDGDGVREDLELTISARSPKDSVERAADSY